MITATFVIVEVFIPLKNSFYYCYYYRRGEAKKSPEVTEAPESHNRESNEKQPYLK